MLASMASVVSHGRSSSQAHATRQESTPQRSPTVAISTPFDLDTSRGYYCAGYSTMVTVIPTPN